MRPFLGQLCLFFIVRNSLSLQLQVLPPSTQYFLPAPFEFHVKEVTMSKDFLNLLFLVSLYSFALTEMFQNEL